MLGLPGAGKTTFSKKVAHNKKLPRFSLDEEYYQIVPNVQQEARDFTIEREVELGIRKKIAAIVGQQGSVVLDYCPWRFVERQEYYQFVNRFGGVVLVYYLDVPREELIVRLEQRNRDKNPTLQFMTPELLDQFYGRFDPPQESEFVVPISARESI